MARVLVEIVFSPAVKRKVELTVPVDKHGAVLTSAVETAVKKHCEGKEFQGWDFIKHVK